jgi:hypothetical protein
MLNEMRQYLTALDIPPEQKRYTMNFCKKMQYLNELHMLASQETGGYVCTGYGNVNSKICFVFKDKNSCDTLRPLIQDILDKFNVNTWDVYMTFVDKTEKEYPKKYSFLVNEIHAINPGLLYVFDKDNSIYLEMHRAFIDRNIDWPEKFFNITVEYLASTDKEVRKLLWRDFRYLINYKEIEQEE